MRLQIAGFIIEVNCDERVVGQMPNYLPFIASETEQGDVLCRIDVGCTLPDETTVPDIVQYIDGKELSIWLRSGYCGVSLKFHNGAFLYRLRADRNWTYIQTDWVPGNPDSLWVLNDFIMIAFIYSAAFHHTVLVHASSVVVSGEGCAFVGPSGVGKSTHSRLWLQYIPGAWLLNDDQPVLRYMPDGRVCIYGSPWSGKTPCYENAKARLRRLYFMKQASSNRLLPLDGVQVFQKLMVATSLIGRDTFSFSAISETLAKIAGVVCGYVLENRPEREAALLSYEVFVEE
ncbi:MAG TPA: hypothetical protein H9922_03250 [Candidatus Phocaeicola caecigallinarum]|nr:hypothetical protein [Candidatus Phocaeicola caecigallinarum]